MTIFDVTKILLFKIAVEYCNNHTLKFIINHEENATTLYKYLIRYDITKKECVYNCTFMDKQPIVIILIIITFQKGQEN